MTNDGSKKLALLIDIDNATYKAIPGLLAEAAKYGTIHVKRAYGDWTNTAQKNWKECLLNHSIVPIQQFAYTTGKNATDGAMIIDAMDLLYTERFDGFCIVSSDSDFTRLVQRIREQGVMAYGFGERKAPRPFVNSCTKFVYFDRLGTEEEHTGSADKKIPAVVKNITDAVPMLKAAINATLREDNRSYLPQVGDYLSKQNPDFDTSDYGHKNLSSLIKASGIAKIELDDKSYMVSLLELPAAPD